MLLDPGKECDDPWCNAVKARLNFNGQTIYSNAKALYFEKPGKLKMLKSNNIWIFGSGNDCKYKESQALWIST